MLQIYRQKILLGLSTIGKSLPFTTETKESVRFARLILLLTKERLTTLFGIQMVVRQLLLMDVGSVLTVTDRFLKSLLALD